MNDLLIRDVANEHLRFEDGLVIGSPKLSGLVTPCSMQLTGTPDRAQFSKAFTAYLTFLGAKLQPRSLSRLRRSLTSETGDLQTVQYEILAKMVVTKVEVFLMKHVWLH